MDLKSQAVTPLPFADYQLRGGGFDQFLAADGSPLPAWGPIAAYLDGLGAEGIQSREATVNRLVDESGAMFFVPGDDGARSRPWQLSAVPTVIDAQTWAQLESGLKQRLRLLEAVLADLLGPQQLLRDRVIPDALLNANPQYHRVYHGLPNASSIRLQLTATDLARHSDGNWWVTGDRTRAPSGLGYLLENRIITSRAWPQLIRQSNVTRLAHFFASLREQHDALAPRTRENPRVAIWTPGKTSYRYFEDAYLARYLGYTLVQGRDMAVRGDYLTLKTLGGLLPIEVVWRHVSDHRCDPLELEHDSETGVVGMLRTVRSGTVAVANAIGSTLAQTPALMPYLPAAAQHLWGETLQLPSLATYWCGDQDACRYVLDHLDQLLLRPAYVVTGAPPINPAEMSAAARDELVAAIRAKPGEYIAQERPQRSTTPVWHDGQLLPWPMALRTFQIQSETGAEVLPGGLGRVSPDENLLDHSPTSGRLGLDCWVIGATQVDTETTLLPSPNAPLRLTRSGAELPSRVAENLFWLGRYVERTESIARLLRTTITRLAGEKTAEELPELPRLVAALAAIGQIEPDHAIEEFGSNLPMLENVLPDSIFDRHQPRGLQSSLRSLIDNAGAVRDRISLDAYRIIARAGDEFARFGRPVSDDLGSCIERLNRLITDVLAFSGLAGESMTRTHGWRFLHLGRRIERGYQTSELLIATLSHPIKDEQSLLEAVLRVTDSLMTYRSRYLSQLQPAAVADLLITDQTNPRSIVFQLQQIGQLIAELQTEATEYGLGEDERLSESLLHRVRMCDPTQLVTVDSAGQRNVLTELLEDLIDRLPKLSDAITARYLIHTTGSETLAGTWGNSNTQ